MATNKFKTMKN